MVVLSQKLRNTAHIMLINNHGISPMIYMIEEVNGRWGIFGGGQEKVDKKSLTRTAIRELHEETLGSLQGHLHFFKHLETYSIIDSNGGVHKTFITINSSIKSSKIKLDQPHIRKGNGDIIKGAYLPLYLVLNSIYKKQYNILFKGNVYPLRYFFAEAIRRNQKYLYTVFNKQYLNMTELRNKKLGINAVTLSDNTNSWKTPI